jgi:hypothetical protein
MTSTRMAMGAAVISCVSAAMMTGALAQENTTNGHFNARAGGNHMSATGQLNGTARQSERPAVSGHANARLGGNHMMATGQPNGQRENETRFRSEGRIGNVQMRERRGFAEERTIGRERLGPMASEGRYDRGSRGERRESVSAEGSYNRGWRGNRLAYRDRGVDVGGGVAAEYTYPGRLYAYAPGYDVGYRGRPFYSYGPTYGVTSYGPAYGVTSYGPAYGVTSYGPAYGVTVGAGPSYAPAYDLAYSTGPYYDYAPGFNVGIGIGPVGIGIGPAWGW